jgi:hypothetical protein
MVVAVRLRWCAAAVACLAGRVGGVGFVYPDFNVTTGLSFNGNASVSSCGESGTSNPNPAYGYNPSHGVVSTYSERGLVREGVEGFERSTMLTDPGTDGAALDETRAGFGHRDAASAGGYAAAPRGECPARLRLTGSAPQRSGSVWRAARAQVLQGFTTTFSFQITDLSRDCRVVRDNRFSTNRYESCSVHGGDGFAFVLHDDPAAELALGAGGSQLGFGGLVNGLAVEFDAWYNPELGDLFEDHVTAFASVGALSAGAAQALHTPVPLRLADGAVHSARVTYLPFFDNDLAHKMQASSSALQFARDNGEGYRLGTLVVYVDDMTLPVVAVPINLSTLITVPGGYAVAGFTAATGRSWASHDVLSWRFCETPSAEECEGQAPNTTYTP